MSFSTLSRSGSLRRSPLSKRSKKAKAKDRARKACVAEVMDRAELRCEMRVPGVCTGWAVHVHEPKPRSGGGDETDPMQAKAGCAACHRFAHAEPAKARALGIVLSRYPVSTFESVQAMRPYQREAQQ